MLVFEKYILFIYTSHILILYADAKKKKNYIDIYRKHVIN